MCAVADKLSQQREKKFALLNLIRLKSHLYWVKSFLRNTVQLCNMTHEGNRDIECEEPQRHTEVVERREEESADSCSCFSLGWSMRLAN